MRILLTHVAPREIGQAAGISVAATNFSYNLISGGCFDKVYSILPTFVKGYSKDEFNDDNLHIHYSVLRNTPFGKFAPVLEQCRIFNDIPPNSSIWLYNVTSLNYYLIKLLRFFKPSVRIYAIILDFTPNDRKAERMLPIINSCDGHIFLSHYSRFNTDNSICLPGIVPSSHEHYPQLSSISHEFLISGELSENISMLSFLLNVFRNTPSLTLHITGGNSEIAAEYSQIYPNIKYHGKVSYEKYLRLLHSTPFLLSTRNPEMPENLCNFPSKIIEGLLHNRIIISSITYPQLSGINYLTIDMTNLGAELKRICNLPEETLLTYANQSHIVENKFSINKWITAIESIETH